MATEKELYERIHELEKQISFLNQQVKEVKFGLNWIDVPEAFDKESENKIPILEEIPELAISNNDGKPTHILIEGDNYHALTCLNYTHRGKVDVIYIDPPYNTGSDGFTYKDKRFLDKYPDGTKLPLNHPLRHSSWLSFMKKRLQLAKDLLKDDGVIFISIGKDELANLINLCNYLFTENNHIGIISRIQKKGSDKGIHFSPAVDYVLAYANDKKRLSRFFEPVSADFPLVETIGKYRGEYYEASKSLYQSSLDSRPNQRYYIECPDGSFAIPPGIVFPDVVEDGSYVLPQSNEDKCWRWSWDQYLKKKDRLVFKESKQSPLWDEHGKPSKWNVYTKRYRFEAEEKGNVPANIIDDCINSLGTNRLSILNLDFSFAKPCELISKLISFTHKSKDIIVLDFFGGSGTTLDAVMQMNDIDNGNRQTIMVQYPEPTFEVVENKQKPTKGCEVLFNQGILSIAKAAYERNKRIMCGYDCKSSINTILYKVKINLNLLKKGCDVYDNLLLLKKEKEIEYDEVKMGVKDGFLFLEGKKKATTKLRPLGNSLKYYRTSFVGKNQPKDATDEDKIELAQKAGCLLAMAENTLYESKNTDYYQFFGNRKDIWTAIYFQEDYSQCETFIDEVRALSGHKNVYFFCWDDGASFASEFDMDKEVEVKSIPQPILDIYKSIGL